MSNNYLHCSRKQRTTWPPSVRGRVGFDSPKTFLSPLFFQRISPLFDLGPLAQAHVIGETSTESHFVQIKKPVEAILLIVAQPGRKRPTGFDLGDGLGPLQLSEYRPQPLTVGDAGNISSRLTQQFL
jgi:hypothetical protein